MERKSSPERAYDRSEFDREVSALLEQILAVPPAERQFFLANKIREMRTRKGAEFGDKLEVLRAAVKRGNLLLELRAAKEILEREDLRGRGRRRTGR
ncbi:MAG: hypothetical protein IBX68_09775 [Dehalococcoidia bacterium]|nr:hypothetical protein [Dehalococcoidia bacterium]